MKSKSTRDLVQIIANGGGVEVDASTRSTQDLVQMAAHAAGSGVVLILTNAASKGQADLVQIAANGKGRVIFRE